MLEVRCGIADYSHENEFFRFFARELKAFFDSRELEGILLGMPTCLVMDALQIDALLVTDSMIVIIDFKDYEGILALPDENDFYRGAWLTNEGIRVKGGSSPNPYSQLSKQRGKLKGILERSCRNDLGFFDVRHVKTMVCFSSNMDFENRVPRSYSRTFSVTDRRSFLEAIYDAVNVNRLGAGLLNTRFREDLGKLFRAEEYDCTIPTSSLDTEASKIQDTATIQYGDTGEDLANAIEAFASNENDVLILTGNSDPDRWAAAKKAQEAAFAAGFAYAPLLVPTRKVAENLAAGYPWESSLYSEIYDPTEKRTKDGIDYVPIKDIDNANIDECEPDQTRVMRTMLIVCEAHLVSDSEWSDSQIMFGSGRLLADTIQYLRLNEDKKTGNKVVFIGDGHQLGYGSISQSCLRKTAYSNTVSVEVHAMEEKVISEGIDEFCSIISKCIDEKSFSLLELPGSEGIHNAPRTRESGFELLKAVSANWSDHRFITYKNKTATDLNLFIKRQILRNGNELAPGDILLVSNQFLASPASGGSFLQTIAGGSLVEVRSIDPVPRIIGPIEGDDATIALSRITFTPKGDPNEYQGFVLLDLLQSDESHLSSKQEKVLIVSSNICKKQYEIAHPFAKGNRWFDAMVESESNYSLDSKGRYRDPSNKSRLTEFERRYREEMEKIIAGDRDSDFFIINNIMRARYGWCITAHKAMSYTWSNVILDADADLGRHSEQYFRFLYTAASRATEHLSLVMWDDISPFDETLFSADPSNSQTNAKRPLLMKLTDIEHAADEIANNLAVLREAGIDFVHLGSSGYQERFAVSRGESTANAAFSYNKKGEVTSIVRQKGDAALFIEVRRLLEDTAQEEEPCEMGSAYSYLELLVGDDAKVRVTRSSSYRDEACISTQEGECVVGIYYNGKGLVTRMDRISGSRDVFSRVTGVLAKAAAD